MAIPTFNSTALFDAAASDMPGQPQARMYIDRMPGANGEYVQPHGKGGRDIFARGLLQGTDASSAATAHAAFKTALRTKQALADGSTVGNYVGTDATTYGDCVLLSYDAGRVHTGHDGTQYVVQAFCRAHVRELTP